MPEGSATTSQPTGQPGPTHPHAHPPQAFLQQQEAGLRFDAAHLRSPALETVVLELPATCLTPLVREPGRLVVTDTRLYFQPQHNVTGDTPVVTHPLAAVAAVARRRSSLRHVGACGAGSMHAQRHGLEALLGTGCCQHTQE